MCCLLQELLVQVLELEPVLLALVPELVPEQLLLACCRGRLALPRRNAESGCNHLLFQALLHTVFR